MGSIKREHGYYVLYSVILLACLSMAVVSSLPGQAPADSVQTLVALKQTPAEEPLPQGVVLGMPEIPTEPCVYAHERLLAGKLLLIDGNHPLPENVPAPNTLSVSGGGAAARSAQTVAAADAIAALKDWFAAARHKGFGSPVVWAGTRSEAQQLQWQLDQLTLYAREHDLVTAARLTAGEREAPGCSEHQTGYAVDIRLCDGYNLPPDGKPLSRSAAGQYLLQSCWRYGFIHRYNEKDPPLCEEESYHFRYVGEAHARMIHLLDLSFPEYLAFLRQHGAVSYYENSELRWLILCQPVDGDWSLRKPRGAQTVDLSLDNTGYAIALFSF